MRFRHRGRDKKGTEMSLLTQDPLKSCIFSLFSRHPRFSASVPTQRPLVLRGQNSLSIPPGDPAPRRRQGDETS